MINQNKQKLIELTKSVNRKFGESCNSAIIRHYQEVTGQVVFNTFANWKKQGKIVKKGEHGFLIWSSPIELKNKNKEEEEENFNYFNICYLFHEGQVK